MLVLRLIAMFTMLVVGIWLLSHVFQALRRRVANAGGLTIPYKTRPVFFIITILVQLAFGVLILWTVGNILNDILADTNRSRGQGIVNAIYAYEHRTHSFPGSLQGLTPGFLQRVPETVNGQDFFIPSTRCMGLIFLILSPLISDAGSPINPNGGNAVGGIKAAGLHLGKC
jgi:hypothetical protein